jgi:hypothetical protein
MPKIGDQLHIVLCQLEEAEILYFSEIYTAVENGPTGEDDDGISLQLPSQPLSDAEEEVPIHEASVSMG